jgi:hypothetical protein
MGLAGEGRSRRRWRGRGSSHTTSVVYAIKTTFGTNVAHIFFVQQKLTVNETPILKIEKIFKILVYVRIQYFTLLRFVSVPISIFWPIAKDKAGDSTPSYRSNFYMHLHICNTK